MPQPQIPGCPLHLPTHLWLWWECPGAGFPWHSDLELPRGRRALGGEQQALGEVPQSPFPGSCLLRGAGIARDLEGLLLLL